MSASHYPKTRTRSRSIIQRILLAILAVHLVFVTDSIAATKYRVLHTFQGGGDGEYPNAGLVADKAGNVYGTTSTGGGSASCSPDGCGTVFELSPSAAGWTKTVLYNFSGLNDGAIPMGSLTIDASGNLYGTTELGGSADQGVVFQLTNLGNSWQETTLYSFTAGDDGFAPSGLSIDKQGNLFGTTLGGQNGSGTVFELSLSNGNWILRTMFTPPMGETLGGGPLASDLSANVYGEIFIGVTNQAGTVFKLTPVNGGWQSTTVYNFCSLANCADGEGPAGGLVWRAGKLYGITVYGGVAKCSGVYCGTVFQLSPSNSNWQETVLYSFTDGSDGGGPTGVVAVDSSGNIYGTTRVGGSNDRGTIFKLTLSNGSWQETVLHSFAGGTDGAGPNSNLALFKQHIFGTTIGGGKPRLGTVFEVTP